VSFAHVVFGRILRGLFSRLCLSARTCASQISTSTNILNRLHKEIVDFYEHIKPRDFEHTLREDLVRNLNRHLSMRYRNASIKPFGSFMTGLYLPTGDMDLVLCSTEYETRGIAVLNAKRELFKFRVFLQSHELALHNDVEVISKAKVPIVKYIDNLTCLKVDVSFENLTGINAVKTFLDWKAQYPAMPILVTLVKHFLMMRALNEPVNGGIGGFTIICLVVSMFQLMPQVQSRNVNTEHHLGDMFMHFLDLYGNKFNYETTAIRLNPACYVPKVSTLSGPRPTMFSRLININLLAEPSQQLHLQEPGSSVHN
jgi:non-canonical poly(A) RNA polymerase PAPD5/7